MDKKTIKALKALIGIADVFLKYNHYNYEDWIKKGNNPEHEFLKEISNLLSIIDLKNNTSDGTSQKEKDSYNTKKDDLKDDLKDDIQEHVKILINDFGKLKDMVSDTVKEFYSDDKKDDKNEDKKEKPKNENNNKNNEKESEDDEHIVDAEYKL